MNIQTCTFEKASNKKITKAREGGSKSTWGPVAHWSTVSRLTRSRRGERWFQTSENPDAHSMPLSDFGYTLTFLE